MLNTLIKAAIMFGIIGYFMYWGLTHAYPVL
jgi:hypothetical protein